MMLPWESNCHRVWEDDCSIYWLYRSKYLICCYRDQNHWDNKVLWKDKKIKPSKIKTRYLFWTWAVSKIAQYKRPKMLSERKVKFHPKGAECYGSYITPSTYIFRAFFNIFKNVIKNIIQDYFFSYGFYKLTHLSWHTFR